MAGTSSLAGTVAGSTRDNHQPGQTNIRSLAGMLAASAKDDRQHGQTNIRSFAGMVAASAKDDHQHGQTNTLAAEWAPPVQPLIPHPYCAASFDIGPGALSVIRHRSASPLAACILFFWGMRTQSRRLPCCNQRFIPVRHDHTL
eukprot:363169-Chlamydomonas_euryale.AAC.54